MLTPFGAMKGFGDSSPDGSSDSSHDGQTVVHSLANRPIVGPIRHTDRGRRAGDEGSSLMVERAVEIRQY